MRPGAAQWRPLIGTPGLTARCDVYLAGQRAAELDSRITLIDASISCDRTRARRWQASGAKFHTATHPRSNRHPLNILTGAMLQLLVGFAEENLWAPLGRYTVRTASTGLFQSGGWLVDATLEDVSYLISRDRLQQGMSIGEAAVADAVGQVLAGRGFAPALRLETVVNELTSPVYLQADTDPWTEAQRLATEAGLELGLSPIGEPILRDPATSTTAAVWSLPADQAMLDADWSQDAEEIANGVIVRLEAAWQRFAVQGSAFDQNPMSPTFVGGPFGRRPKVVTSSSVANDAQALELAKRHLAQAINSGQVDVTVAANPLLEPGDVIMVSDPTLNLHDRLVLDSWSMSTLHANATMRLALRQVDTDEVVG